MCLPFEVAVPDVDERLHAGEGAAEYVQRLARAKAAAVAGASRAGETLVIGADTTVVLGRQVLGKPRDAADAAAMVLRLSGRTHRVMTGVAVSDGARTRAALSISRVRFRAIEPAEAEAYAATGEGLDKAGGYGIQGIGGIFVETLRGSYSAVVGLPLMETERLLTGFGLDTWRLRRDG